MESVLLPTSGVRIPNSAEPVPRAVRRLSYAPESICVASGQLHPVMDAQRIEEISEWDERPFSDGFADLRRLADREFSGAATNGTGWLFMLNGRVVGTVDADLDAFADASGTVYDAPEEVLPLLFAMQERGGEKRAQYYTNDTPLSEANRKLSQGGFTGYIELSENVLSGDYYVTYTGGESRSAAFVGNSRRLETGEDAFGLADDEVGIYSVYEVDLDVREIPANESGHATGSEDTSHAPAADADERTGDADEVTGDADEVTGDADEVTGDADERTGDADERTGDADERTGDVDEVTDTEAEGADDSATDADAGDVDEPLADSDTADGGDSTTGSNAGGDGPATDVGEGRTRTASNSRTGSSESSESTRTGSNGPSTDGSEEASATDHGSKRSVTGPQRESPASGTDRPPAAESSAHEARGSEDVFSEEAEWREAKSIPALDPDEASDEPGRTSRAGDPRSGRSDRSGSNRPASGRSDARPNGTQQTSNGRRSSPEPRSTGESAGGSAVTERSSVQRSELNRELQRLESALERTESELEAVEADRDSLAAEREELAAERDRLESEVTELESEIDALESEVAELESELERTKAELTASSSGDDGVDRRLSAAEARERTNLFIRYDSKGGVTLDDVHDGAVDPDALEENLRIEHHTSFDSDGVAVDGVPFEEFLHGTLEYTFTRWLVQELPFEIGSTGNESALRDLYDSLPEIDRAEIGGSVSVITREGGEENREQRTFDLVLRDRMGNPLFIADLNAGREPTEEGTLESLVSHGGDIAESNDSFAGAFAVTASFFEPGALETASDAVGGGLFGRSKRKSFVKLSRKRGYHLCLVESRDESFHVTVPEL